MSCAGLWVMVADGRVARVFRKRGDDISLVAEVTPEITEELKNKKGVFAHKIAAWPFLLSCLFAASGCCDLIFLSGWSA